jgi:DNA-binding transcriptional LysR family regulator
MLMIGAAKAGLGLAYVSELQTAAEVKAGQLEVVLADYTPRAPGFFLYFPRRAQRMPKLRALIDSLALQRAEKPGRR